MSIKKIIVVDNEERKAGSIGSEGSKGLKGKEAASPLFSGCRPRIVAFPSRETRIQSLSDFTLEFLCIARNNLTRIASYLRKAMTKLCIKILVKADSAIESAFPYGKVPRRGG